MNETTTVQGREITQDDKYEALSKQRCLGHLLAEIKKIQEKNKFAPESVDGMFCQELKTVVNYPVPRAQGVYKPFIVRTALVV